MCLQWPMVSCSSGRNAVKSTLVADKNDVLGGNGSTKAKVLKILKENVNTFKAQLDKIWLHQTIKFDFTADLTRTENR